MPCHTRTKRPLALTLLVVLVGLLPLVTLPQDGRAGHVADGSMHLEEVVTDPQTDWNGDGRITTSDEYVTLRNDGQNAIDLTGWTLEMNDSTPVTIELDGTVLPADRHTILNPTGQNNNDVRLVLRRPDGAVAHDAHLGTTVPDGNAEDERDEAVHITGPWGGHKAPGTGGRGLGPVWVDTIHAAHEAPPTTPFVSRWIGPDDNDTLRVAMHLRIAPGEGFEAPVLDLAHVRIALERHADGQWRATIPGNVTDGRHTAHVNWTTGRTDAFPNGTAITVALDQTGPTIGATGNEPGVLDPDGRIRWLPAAQDDGSGVASYEVYADPRDTSEPLPDCAPAHDPGPACRVDLPHEQVLILVRDHAGHTNTTNLSVQVDDEPPVLPAALSFAGGPPPTVRWTPPEPHLRHLAIEITSTPNAPRVDERHSLPVNATSYVDVAWQPGQDRAYRLNATDRAWHVNTTGWISLDPDAVPVQWRAIQAEDALNAWAQGARAHLDVRTDRALDEVPRLHVQIHGNGTRSLAVSGAWVNETTRDHVRYDTTPPPWFPQQGSGALSLTGATGLDAAPLDEARVLVAWDKAPPMVRIDGAHEAWVRAPDRTVTVTASDGGTDPEAVDITLDPIPGVRIEVDDSGGRVIMAGDGWYVVHGNATDAAGNERPFRIEAGLDETPPVLQRAATLPHRWSHDEPWTIRVHDNTSGLRSDAVQVWARAPGGLHLARIAALGDGVFDVRPGPGAPATLTGVHLAAADHAGNVLELTLGRAGPGGIDGARPAGAGAGGHARFPHAGEDADPGAAAHVMRIEDPGAQGGAPPAAGTDGRAESGRAVGSAHSSGAAAGAAGLDQRTWDWVAVGLVAAGGSIGLGTMVKRGRPTGRRSS